MSNKYLTVKEASKKIKVSKNKIYKLLKNGKLNGKKVNGRWEIEDNLADFYVKKIKVKKKVNKISGDNLEFGEYQGLWWFPGEEEDAFTGTLVIQQNKEIVLKTIKSEKTEAFVEKINKQINKYDIILGVTTSGHHFTLYYCIRFGDKRQLFGLEYTSFNFFVEYVIFGAHFNKVSEINVSSLSVNYSYLNEWVHKTGIQIKNAFEKKKQYQIEYKFPDDMFLADFEGYYMFIEYQHSRSAFPKRASEARIIETKFITTEFSAPKTFKECIDYVIYLQNFLTLAVGENSYPNIIRATVDGITRILGDKEYQKQIEIYYRVINKVEVSKEVDVRFMNFSLPNIIGRTNEVIKNWFYIIESIKPVFDLYFAIIYSPDTYQRHKFLSFIQAIEVYHRRILSKPKYLESIHENIVRSARSSVEKKYRNWVDSKLKWNEPSLRERLKEIGRKYENLVKSILPEWKITLDKTVDTRNYFTHFDETLKEKAVTDPLELNQLTEKLRKLVKMLLLISIGMKDIEIDIILNSQLRNMHF